jgi:hypothetical protein
MAYLSTLNVDFASIPRRLTGKKVIHYWISREDGGILISKEAGDHAVLRSRGKCRSMERWRNTTRPAGFGAKQADDPQVIVWLLRGVVGGEMLRYQAAGLDEPVESGAPERIASDFMLTEGSV